MPRVPAGVLEPEGSMKAIAGLIGLSDAGEDLPVAALGEPAQQLRVELASCAGAVMVVVHIDTGLSRPLEGNQTLQWLPIRKADDPIVSLEDEPFVGGAKPTDARSHFGDGRDVEFPTDRCVLDVGAVNRQARSGIRWRWCLARARASTPYSFIVAAHRP